MMDTPLTFTGAVTLPEAAAISGTVSQPVIFTQAPMEGVSVTVTENGMRTIRPSEGFEGLKNVEITTDVQPPLEEVEINVEIESGIFEITPSDGYYGISKATVKVIDPEGWKPNPTWWDIEAIVQASENQESRYKCIQLLSDNDVSTSFNDGMAYRTSDGARYSAGFRTHTWDASKDKPCIIGGQEVFNTRWVIVYYQTAEIPSLKVNSRCLYFVMDGLTPSTASFSSNVLQSYKQINGAGFHNLKSMGNLFNGCYSLQTIPALESAQVTSMNSMFANCYSLQTIPVLDTRNVTNMTNMFYNCYSLQTIPVFDTRNVANMSNMFNGCYTLQTIPALGTASAANMTSMFANCSALKAIPALDTANTTNMNSLFYNCSSLQTIPALDTGSVTHIDSMFYGCGSLICLKSVISITNMELIYSPLNRGSLLYMIDHLPPAETTKKLMLGASNLAKLTPDEKAVATSKNWTLS